MHIYTYAHIYTYIYVKRLCQIFQGDRTKDNIHKTKVVL